MTNVYAQLSESDPIGEEALAQARTLIGQPLRLDQWNTEAARDNIRHYALGLGDRNPLWTDAEYARGSAHGTIVAPPTFLYSVYCGLAPGLGGLPAFLREASWTFLDWVRLGDQLKAAASITDVELAENKRGEKRIKQYGRMEYFRITEAGDPVKVAECDQIVTRTPGPGHNGALAYESRGEYSYSAKELEDIERATLAVSQRGREPRFWEDVHPGDDLGQVVKGPFTRMSMVCYYAGAPGSPGYRAFDWWWHNHHLARHDPGMLPNTFDSAYFAGTGTTSHGHHDATVAHAIGMPGIYDNGNQRIGLVATALTNWMGDDAFLRSYSHKVNAPVVMGDTLFVTGRVTEKGPRQEALNAAARPVGEVRIELRARNQLGQVVSTAEAAVWLPTRTGHGG